MTVATDMLEKYLVAEAAVLDGKEVSLGDRKLRMEDLNMIISGRKEWEQRVAAEVRSTTRVPSVGGMRFSLANFGGQ